MDTFEAYQKSHLAPQIGIGDAGEGFITIGLPKGLSGPRADWANTLDIGFERTEKDAERSYRFASSFGTEDISGHKGNAVWAWDRTPTSDEAAALECLSVAPASEPR